MRRFFSTLRWDLTAVVLMLAMWGGYRALSQPWIQPAQHKTVDGSRPPDRTEGDVLLLLPNRPAATAEKLSQLDCTYGWFNSLWQHFGSFATALTRELTPGLLAGRHTVIVPRRVASDMPANGIEALREFVRDGGQLLLEQPGADWQRLTGITIGTDTTPAGSISSLEGLGMHGPLRRHLPNVPLSGDLLAGPTLDPWPQGKSMLEVDGQTGVALQRLGDGLVYTLLFDFGCSITGLQQGTPDTGMRFQTDAPAPDNLIPAIDRVASEAMTTSDIPYADLLEYALFRRLSDHRPVPRLWPYPADHLGALMTVFPTPQSARGALAFSKYAHLQDAPTVVPLAADRANRDLVETLADRQATPGLLWVHGLSRPRSTTTWGVGPIEPYGWERNLRSQRQLLETFLRGDARPRVVRSEGARLAAGWAETFRQLAAASLQIDVSMGPTRREHWGFAFGTGFPFYPLDRQGLPFPVLEMPFVLHGPNMTNERLDTLLTRSSEYFHQALTVSLPSSAMRDEPTPDILLTYRELFEQARAHDHWITTPSTFARFLASRRRSILTSQWYPSDDTLTISLNLVGVRTSRGDDDSRALRPGIAIPRTHEGRRIQSLSIDGESIDPADATVSGPGSELIISVDAGRHTIDVTYKPPATASPDAGVN